MYGVGINPDRPHRELFPPPVDLAMPGVTYPPFPDNVPTHPLLVIDYGLINVGDEQEINRLWEAATTLGFW